MIRRLIGLLMIIVILMPLLLGAVLFTTAQGFVGEMQTVLEPRIAAINQRVSTIGDSLETVQDAAQRINNSLGGFISDINSVASTIRNTLNIRINIPLPNLPDVRITIPVINRSITIPLPNLGNLNLEIPGMRQVRDFFDNVFDFFGRIANTLADLAAVQVVVQDVGVIVAETQQLASEVIAALATYSQGLILALGLFVLWIVLAYLVMVYRYLVDGWRMMMGRA